MSNKKQTAVELIHSEYKRILGNILVNPSQGIEIADAFEQAKELEKQQIIDAYRKGKANGIDSRRDEVTNIPANDYYTDTYDK